MSRRFGGVTRKELKAAGVGDHVTVKGVIGSGILKDMVAATSQAIKSVPHFEKQHIPTPCHPFITTLPPVTFMVREGGAFLEYPHGFLPTEDQDQESLVNYLDAYHPDLDYFAVPNGGFRSKRTAGKLKKQGVKAGVPDMVFALARGRFHGFYLENKRLKGGETSKKQLDWHARLKVRGYYVRVEAGLRNMIAAVEYYLALPPFGKGDL